MHQISDNVTIQSETAWGQGPGFPGKNWAMYFMYTIQECTNPVVINPGDFRTQTQGGWGTACSGNNPGCYRDNHFTAAFPSDAKIGIMSFSNFGATFTSSLAVEKFLPANGTPGVFTTNYVNPINTSAGVLAGQVLALTLSVTFDQLDPNFGASSIFLKDLIVADNSSICYGMTVQQVLIQANNILAGIPSPLYPPQIPSQINSCVDAINNNFVDGTHVGTYLTLP
ncbi:MAG: hypothetical protein ACK5Z5_09285 [Neisseriaceae bacterium]